MWLVTALMSVAAFTWLGQVDAAACAKICYTTDLTGFGPGGTAGCSCSGSEQGARTGSGSCSCGQCYDKANGAVIGYALNSDGVCTYGTNCGDCDYSDSSSSKDSSSTSTNSSESTKVTNSTTNSTATNSSIHPRTNTYTSSDASSDNVGDTAGSTATSSSDSSLMTWQIALIICCGVLVFTVAVVSVLSCYCKARNRLNENEEDQTDVNYYQQQHPRPNQDVYRSGTMSTAVLFPQNPSSGRSQMQYLSSGSTTNELKALYANSTSSSTSDRVGVGLAPVHLRTSSIDSVEDWNMSDRRQSNRSHGSSFEQGYNLTRDQDSMAVQL